MGENKPFLAVLTIQLIYAGYFLLTKLAFDVGMNTFVFVFYRQAAATLFLVPIAIFLERKSAPTMTFSIFIKMFFLSLLGITMGLDVVGVALKYTTATLGAATSNTLPVITFFLALLFGMEKLNIRKSSGILKVVGVSLCIGGIITIAFYRGPLLKLLLHHHLITPHFQNHTTPPTVPSPTTWIKGVFLMILANLAWAFWLILQGKMLKSYPSKLLLTTIQCSMSTIQSFIVAALVTRDPIDWQLGFNIRLVSVAYCGVVVTGLTFYLQTWVVEKKGPVFLAMTTPLIMVFTTIISAFVVGEIIGLGSVLGAVMLVGGLYFVLWGKAKEEGTNPIKDVEKPSNFKNQQPQ
ncbi:WAT1-related protein At5g64700-like [Andrographis paniculata]|uniref:WAT1-related protein At5g64700-like n=1 Tax=Andrographis paniculata TaxID=175694 RepID=UPI0021E706D7|nr:WAT1-related protein At5g64700-like [Andrographis paniculata]